MNKAAANLGSIELALVETCRQLAVSVESVKTLGAAQRKIVTANLLMRF